jgi:hypothetical protein
MPPRSAVTDAPIQSAKHGMLPLSVAQPLIAVIGVLPRLLHQRVACSGAGAPAASVKLTLRCSLLALRQSWNVFVLFDLLALRIGRQSTFVVALMHRCCLLALRCR